jgi:hypothetical protein
MPRIKIKDLTEDEKGQKITEDELQKVRGGIEFNPNLQRPGSLGGNRPGSLGALHHGKWVNAPTFKQDIFKR